MLVENVTIYFLKKIIAMQKNYITNAQIRKAKVPQYKNLSIEKIIDFVTDRSDVEHYLPDDEDMPKIPK